MTRKYNIEFGHVEFALYTTFVVAIASETLLLFVKTQSIYTLHRAANCLSTCCVSYQHTQRNITTAKCFNDKSQLWAM